MHSQRVGFCSRKANQIQCAQGIPHRHSHILALDLQAELSWTFRIGINVAVLFTSTVLLLFLSFSLLSGSKSETKQKYFTFEHGTHTSFCQCQQQRETVFYFALGEKKFNFVYVTLAYIIFYDERTASQLVCLSKRFSKQMKVGNEIDILWRRMLMTSVPGTVTRKLEKVIHFRIWNESIHKLYMPSCGRVFIIIFHGSGPM